MLADGLDGRPHAAGMDRGRFAPSAQSMAELALLAFAAAILAFVVVAHSHGVERLLALLASLAVVAGAGLSLMGGLRAAARLQQSEAATAAAAQAIDGASRAIRVVLGAAEQDLLPSLDKMIVKITSMASDRRLSASVRRRLTTIRTSGESVRTILEGFTDPAGLELKHVAVEPAPVAVIASREAATRSPAVTPRAEESEVEAASPMPSFAAVQTLQHLHPLRVLAAEADEAHQLVLRTLLAQVGVEAEIVGDGVELIEAWRCGSWDVILVDVQQPEIDDAARMIRSAETKAGWVCTPLIALAAHPKAKQIAELAAGGIDGCVAKPIVGPSLFAAIEAVLAIAAPAEFAEVA